MKIKSAIILLLVAASAGCSDEAYRNNPVPGPDKMGAEELKGAATGAGAGAITGFQVSSATGPGAVIGAGMGAVAGAIRGYAVDQSEESLMRVGEQTKEQRQIAVAQRVLAEQYQRRAELHPQREIFPADIFFYADESKLRPDAYALVRELAKVNKARKSWSRLVVTAYVKAADPQSPFAQKLAGDRSEAISDALISAGLEQRRVQAKGVIVDAPVLIDPQDRPDRYAQAIELTPIDR